MPRFGSSGGMIGRQIDGPGTHVPDTGAPGEFDLEEQPVTQPRAINRAAVPCAAIFVEQRVRLGQAAAEPVQERDWRDGGMAGYGDGVAAGGGGGGGGGVREEVVVGGSVQVGDVLLGGDEGDLGMHG